MSEENDEAGEEASGELEIPVNVQQLRAAYQYGVAATIMPVHDGWKIAYFSSDQFEEREGTTFTTFEEAMAGIAELLPVINSEEEKAKLRDMEEILWLRLQRKIRREQE